MKSRLIIVLNYFMLVVFLYMVGVQYNDPDALLWIGIYGIAAVICFLASRGRLPWFISALMAVAVLGWALTLAPQVIGKVSFGELFVSMEMKTLAIEQAREMGGLLIVAFWMIALTVTIHHREKGKKV
jgi:integral membrane sensor domain MASE1